MDDIVSTTSSISWQYSQEPLAISSVGMNYNTSSLKLTSIDIWLGTPLMRSWTIQQVSQTSETLSHSMNDLTEYIHLNILMSSVVEANRSPGIYMTNMFVKVYWTPNTQLVRQFLGHIFILELILIISVQAYRILKTSRNNFASQTQRPRKLMFFLLRAMSRPIQSSRRRRLMGGITGNGHNQSRI